MGKGAFVVVFHWFSAIHWLLLQQLPLSSSWYHAKSTLVVGQRAPERNVYAAARARHAST